MMKITFKDLFNYIVLTAILLTPVFSYGEIIGLFRGTIYSQSVIVTPVYIKGIKDCLFLLITFLAILDIFKKKKINILCFTGILLIFLVIILSMFITAFSNIINNNICLTILSGLRWAFPLILIFFIYNLVDETILIKITNILLFLFVVHLLVQIYQLFNMSDWYGRSSLGFAQRVPGIFFIPSAGAFFSLIVLFFTLFYKKQFRLIIILLTVLSVALTKSGTGIIVYILVLSIYLIPRKYYVYTIPVFVVLLIVLMLNLDSISGRGEGYIEQSGGERLNIFQSSLQDSGFISNKFGMGTNTSILLQGEGIIADSMYSSIAINTGYLGLLLLIIFFIPWIYMLFLKLEKELIAFSIIFLIFSAIIILTEAFPMNLIFSVMASYYIKKYYHWAFKQASPLI